MTMPIRTPHRYQNLLRHQNRHAATKDHVILYGRAYGHPQGLFLSLSLPFFLSLSAHIIKIDDGVPFSIFFGQTTCDSFHNLVFLLVNLFFLIWSYRHRQSHDSTFSFESPDFFGTIWDICGYFFHKDLLLQYFFIISYF